MPLSFLAPRSLDLLPIASTVKAAMRRFGLHTMGEVAAMSRDMLAEQFGPAGGRAWDLSHGIDDSPLVPLKHEETVVERASLPFSSTSMPLLLAAVDTLLRRAYSRPRDAGPVRRQRIPGVRAGSGIPLGEVVPL